MLDIILKVILLFQPLAILVHSPNFDGIITTSGGKLPYRTLETLLKKRARGRIRAPRNSVAAPVVSHETYFVPLLIICVRWIMCVYQWKKRYLRNAQRGQTQCWLQPLCWNIHTRPSEHAAARTNPTLWLAQPIELTAQWLSRNKFPMFSTKATRRKDQNSGACSDKDSGICILQIKAFKKNGISTQTLMYSGRRCYEYYQMIVWIVFPHRPLTTDWPDVLSRHILCHRMSMRRPAVRISGVPKQLATQAHHAPVNVLLNFAGHRQLQKFWWCDRTMRSPAFCRSSPSGHHAGQKHVVNRWQFEQDFKYVVRSSF